jgi:hypothetical protein
VSRRGVGKTFTVMTELVKLSMFEDCAGYTQFIYITDKTTDNTVNELIKLIKLKTRVVKYEQAYECLNVIMNAKTAYEQVIKEDIEDKITEESKRNILESLDIDEFYDNVPHTAILMDDAMNILKETKFKKLRDLIFQNRQPKFTIFICCQDVFGIPPSIKRNIDTAWIFTGFTDKTMFGTMARQLGSPLRPDELWKIYNRLKFREALIFDFENGKINLKVFVDGRLNEV